ncbi:hypothetical protein MNBD_BACTEROID07-223 [hydrothermal vent metagenome]|uniref:Porin n=1 Tax=hydrothermal vent metagenome TaxID=652676 RepID=A0A3B0V2R8_9ZZZZ
MRRFTTLFAALFVAAGLYAQNVIPGGTETIKLKGFVSFTTFMQDQSFKFGNGQNAEWANPPKQTTKKWFNGFDVRNTRLTLVFNGHKKKSQKWKFGGVMEVDFFGGHVGSSLFAAQMPMLRLRLAYMDLIHDNIRIRFGQAWTPMFGNVPVSLSHIAFPLGYGSAGFVGWRFPGIYTYWGLNGNESPVKIRMDFAVFAGSWNGPGSNTDFLNAGNFGSPQTELKFNFIAKKWSAYIVGHADKKNLAPENVNDKSLKLTGLAAEVGAKYHSGGFLIQGNIYTGKNIGQQFGAITQVQDTSLDLHSTGGWFQVGYVFAKKIGIYGFYGAEKVNHKDALAAFSNPRTAHNLYDLMLKYNMRKAAIGIEWLHSSLTYGKADDNIQGNQISLSALYKF